MLLKNKIYFGLLLIVFCFSAGCMVGPKYKRPRTIADEAGWSFSGSEYTQDANNPGRWWERFKDKTTNTLVQNALENNYDVKAAAAKVL